MAVIVCSAKKLEKRNRRHSIPGASSDIEQTPPQNFVRRLSASSSVLASSEQRTLERNTSKTREITKQALLYIGSFWLSYGWMLFRHIYIAIANKTSFTLAILNNIFFPLQGFLNMFIFCRPHIVSLQKRYPGEYTWFRAFQLVLKSGGDSCHLTVAEERHRQEQDNKNLLVDNDFPGEGISEENNTHKPITLEDQPVSTDTNHDHQQSQHNT